MAGRASKVRKYKSKFDSSRAKKLKELTNEVALQQSYISDYAKFSGIAKDSKSWSKNQKVKGLPQYTFTPQQPRSRKIKSKKIGEDQWGNEIKSFARYEAFSYLSPQDIIGQKGGSTSIRATPSHERKFVNYREKGNRALPQTYRKIASNLRPFALDAEMGNLADAQSALAAFDQTLEFDSSNITGTGGNRMGAVYSSNKKSGTGVSSASGWGAANTSKPVGFALVNKPERSSTEELLAMIPKGGRAEDLANKVKQPMPYGDNGIPGWDGPIADNFFGTIRDDSGQVLPHTPSEESLDFFKGMKLEELEKKYTLNNTIHNAQVDYVRSTQKKEDKLQSQLDAAYKELDQQELWPVETYDKVTGKTTIEYKKKTDRDGSTIYRYSEESNLLNDKIYSLESQLHTINNDQAVVAHSLSSGDKASLVRALSKTGAIDENIKSQYFQSVGSPDRQYLEQEVADAGFEHKQQSQLVGSISSEITQLEYLQKNNRSGKNQDKINSMVQGLEQKYGDRLNTVFDFSENTDGVTSAKRIGSQKQAGVINTVAELTSVDGIMHQLEYQKQQEVTKANKTRKKQLEALSALSSDKTNLERTSSATSFNKTIKVANKNKKKFEEMTGMKAESNAAASMDDWYYSIGALNPEGTTRTGYIARDVNTDWYSSWLNEDTMFSRDTDLTIFGEDKKHKLQNKLTQDMNVIEKYDSWGQANKYIGTSLSEWKQGLTSYYKGDYVEPDVTQDQVNMYHYGTKELTGDSFIENVIVEEMDGTIRSGVHWRQDTKKLTAKTKDYEQKMRDKIAEKRQSIKSLQAKQDEADIYHDTLKPQISTAVDKGIKFGDISYDDDLSKKLASSSIDLYSKKWDTKEMTGEVEYLEKSLAKTIKDRERLEQEIKRLDYDQMQSQSHNVTNYRAKSSPGRPSLKSFSRRNDGGGGQQKTRGGQSTLGGLVV